MNTAVLESPSLAERYGINPKLFLDNTPPPPLDVGPPDRRALIERASSRIEDFRRLRDAGLIQKDGDFYPSVHYPPIVMYPPMTDDELLEGYTLPSDGMVDVMRTSRSATRTACSVTIR
jgi:hypothetical protein